MVDTTNFYGTDLDDVIDFSRKPLLTSTYSVARSGKSNDYIILTPGKWAVAGLGNDTITSAGFGVFGIKYDESPNAVKIDASKGTVEDGYGNIDSIKGINAFWGSTYDDTIIGSSANEYFGTPYYGGSGNDTYIGGGGFDVVVYFSKSSDYKITVDTAEDTATVTWLKEGFTDYLKGISQIQFRDVNIDLKYHSPSHDYIYGTNSNDLIYAGHNPYFYMKGGDTINGSGGFDEVFYPTPASDFEVTTDLLKDTATVTWKKTGEVDTLIGISKINFLISNTNKISTSITLKTNTPASETIAGTDANELLMSTASRSNLSSDGDKFIGGGGFDIVFYAGKSSDFIVNFDPLNQTGKVTWSNGTVDELKNISKVQFSDALINLLITAPTKEELSSIKLSDWNSYKSQIDFMQNGLNGKPVGFNLDKIWYGGFQIAIDQFSVVKFQTHADATFNTVVGYGTYVVRNDNSLLVVSSGWDPVIGANGRYSTAVIKDGLLEMSSYKTIEGATHSYVLEDANGDNYIISMGVDEGKLALKTNSDGTIAGVSSGQANAPSVLINVNTLEIVERTDLSFSSHGSQSIDFNDDQKTDVISIAWDLPTKNGNPFILVNDGNGNFTIKELGSKLNPNQIVGMSMGWLGKQTDGTYAIVLGDANSAANPSFEPERNYVVYLNVQLDAIVRYQKLPTPIFEDPIYQDVPLVYQDWKGNVGTSHDMCIRTIDINGDGRLDIVIGEKISAMPSTNGNPNPFGSIQILIDQGDGKFADETKKRLYGFLTTFGGAHHFEFKDINGDGFLDILLEDYGLSAAPAHSIGGNNWPYGLIHPYFALVNDGTGHYVSVIHEQLSLLSANYAKTQFAIDYEGKPLWVQWSSTDLSNVVEVSIIQVVDKLSTGPNLTNPAQQGAPGFNEFYYLLNNKDVQTLINDGTYASGLEHFIKTGKYEGREAFAPNARVVGSEGDDQIILREGNEITFAQAGDDSITGDEGNDTIDGGQGYDISTYSKTSSNYKLTPTETGWTLINNSGIDGNDTLSNIEQLQFTDRSVIIESQSHGSYADLPTELYQFFITAFNAAPGVTYMDQLAEAYRYGLSVKQIVDIFTTKKQFTDVYSPSLSHADMASQLVNNIVKNSAILAAKTEAITDIKGALDIGWTVGDVIYTVFGNLAHKSLNDNTWGNTARQFNNEIAVAKYYTEVLNQSTTDLETLRDVIQPVTQSTDVSSDVVVAQLIGVALMTGGTIP
jgi:hypothetical protein